MLPVLSHFHPVGGVSFLAAVFVGSVDGSVFFVVAFVFTLAFAFDVGVVVVGVADVVNVEGVVSSSCSVGSLE